MSGAPCQNCGAPRRDDGMAFCAHCGLPYANWNQPRHAAPRPPPTFRHPWFLFIVLGALVGAVAALVAKDVTLYLFSLASDEPLFAAAFWIGLWSLYWLPTVVAVFRRRMPVWTIALMNLVIGPTVLGWLAALWLAGGGNTYSTVRKHFTPGP